MAAAANITSDMGITFTLSGTDVGSYAMMTNWIIDQDNFKTVVNETLSLQLLQPLI